MRELGFAITVAATVLSAYFGISYAVAGSYGWALLMLICLGLNLDSLIRYLRS